MNKKLDTSRRFAVSLMAGLLLFSGANSYADDTEIFFGGPAIDSGIRPNVLFVLDNSGSMNWRLNSNNTATGTQKSRMDVLKESFADIMNNTRDINVGVMVLNGRSEYGDSRFVYPVTYIDQSLPGNADLVATTPGIRASTDDATQGNASNNNRAVVTDPTLVMGTISSLQDIEGSAGTSVLTTTGAFYRVNVSGTEYACRLNPPSRNNPIRCTNTLKNDLNLRRSAPEEPLFNFQGLNVPGTATISEAYIEVTPTNTPGNSGRRNPVFSVQVERSKAPAALNDNNTLGTRSYLNSDTTQAFGWISGNRVRMDITGLIQTLRTATPATNPTNSPITGVFVRLTPTTNNNNNQDYTFCVEGCAAGNAPTLVIRYTSQGYAPEQRMGALRFQDVGIPQGATITEARISFVPAATTEAPFPTFQVKAERTGNASSFTTGEDLTSRSTTTATTSWSPTNWPLQATPAPIQGPDVTAQVQEVVGLSGWCGNNAMAFYLTPTSTVGAISASSFDGAGGLQPTLTVSYTGGTGGCFNSIVEARITEEKNDGHQNNSGTVTLAGQTLPMTTREIGARFDNLPINPGAEIMEAKVLITPAATVNNPSLTSQISFQNSNTPSAFTTGNNNFSNRSSRTSEVQCQINSTTGWVTGQPVVCDIGGLASSLTSLFSVSNSWTRGNALNMFIRHTSTSSLTAVAYETNPSQSIKLRLKIRNGGLSNTVRSHVNALVQNMYAEDGTPIVPTLYDSARYMRGSISGRDSPINSTCQANHIVLLTDGQANNNTTSAVNGITSIIGESCTSADSGELCARDLAKFLAENDQSSSIEGTNTITTHTVGFALDASGATASAGIKRFLAEVATNGGGGSYTAESASELSSAFNRIIQEVLATDTTFVSPGATVNQFNRQTNRNEIYFALFKPSETDRWIGNLKRYKLTNTTGSEVLDADDVPAIDQATGFFKASARSFWTASADGSNTALGGVAANLPANASRKLFTYFGNSPTSGAVTLDVPAHRIDTANTTNLTESVLGATDTTERSQLINWIRGTNTDGTVRNSVGDPLHSVPRLLTYQCNTFSNTALTACSSEDQTAFVGTNEGLVHAFNTATGEEQFAFMPAELLPNIKPLMVNAKSTSVKPRVYGMDNSVVLWANDLNGNGVIYGGRDPSSTDTPRLLTGLNTGEFVYAYATMGRGGRSLYALDVTDRASPKMLWFIKGGETPGFERLGQTWSTPVLTTVDIGGTATKVLIFGGGYDTNQDNVRARTADGMGNAIYIVNATTGALIWSASGAATGHTLRLNKMQYSIPAPIRVIDIDRNGKADQFFVGDMGGQVWRFFINNGSAASSLVSPVNGNGSGAPDADDGVFADVIGADTGTETATQLEQKLRRFYNEPDVALLNINGTRTLAINIGSGYRGHPLNAVTQDRFYSFRTPLVYNPTTDAANNHTTLVESNLYDATDNLIQEGSATQQTAAATAFARTSGGWYIRLEGRGEKVLSESATFAGLLVFTTYEPTASLNSCRAAQGISRAYTVNLFDATPAAENVSGTPDKADRATLLKTAGIPPKPVFLLPDNGSGNDGDGSGGGKDNGPWVLCIGTVCKTIKGPYQESTYWIDDN
ncbi:PilC/PilY family type IV pilus protein [Metapseudomonas furukawaii]|uniref:Type IV fimbrial biogenesis protein PilY1 n=1 Tax=Metapseudomonas furukawaii TaxID=1149133 RepID=A0AAD1BWW4_METFU|nr:PilC/PilY family type IV pilus protein [Pseudomonas furukawaii]ELS24614.1 Type IV fimbrial biogenesis protein PilY1 [Pseudomonas furukawaii]BAU72546.1 type IV fimbrial biogenesis protein PilY1 [Pseudomonas furukawaii]